MLEPAPGLLAEILANLEAAGERHAVRSMLTGRRLAYARRHRRGHRGRAPPAPSCSPAAPARLKPSRADAAGGRLAAGEAVAAIRRSQVLPPRAVAQLAEHRSPKPQVGGSSPSCPARPVPDPEEAAMAMNRAQKRMLQRQGALGADGSRPRHAQQARKRRRRPQPRAGQGEADRPAPVPPRGPGRAAQGGLADPRRGHQLLDHRARRPRRPDGLHRRRRLRRLRSSSSSSSTTEPMSDHD